MLYLSVEQAEKLCADAIDAVVTVFVAVRGCQLSRSSPGQVSPKLAEARFANPAHNLSVCGWPVLADSPEELICLAATDSTLAATDSTAPIGVVPIENSGNTKVVLS